MQHTMTLDTLAAAKELKAAGAAEPLAEAIVQVNARMLTAQVATKSDLDAVTVRLDALTAQVATKSDLAELRADFQTGHANLRTDFASLRYHLLAGTILSVLSVVGLLQVIEYYFDL